MEQAAVGFHRSKFCLVSMTQLNIVKPQVIAGEDHPVQAGFRSNQIKGIGAILQLHSWEYLSICPIYPVSRKP